MLRARTRSITTLTRERKSVAHVGAGAAHTAPKIEQTLCSPLDDTLEQTGTRRPT